MGMMAPNPNRNYRGFLYDKAFYRNGPSALRGYLSVHRGYRVSWEEVQLTYRDTKSLSKGFKALTFSQIPRYALTHGGSPTDLSFSVCRRQKNKLRRKQNKEYRLFLKFATPCGAD